MIKLYAWVPRWLGESYARLYAIFELETFTLSDVKKTLCIDEGRARVIVSKLHRYGLLIVFEKKRPRIYRLLSPDTFMMLASDTVRKVEIPQERYLELIYLCYRVLRRKIRIKSFVVYGSVARGTAKENSDLDLLVVSDSFHGSMGRRIELLANIVYEHCRNEILFLRKKGYNVSLSFYPLKTVEVERLPIILLDMVDDARIVYDEDRFFELILLKLKEKLLKAKRVKTEKGWYWDLKPDYKPYEVVEL